MKILKNQHDNSIYAPTPVGTRKRTFPKKLSSILLIINMKIAKKKVQSGA
jgi:hypothetical protein